MPKISYVRSLMSFNQRVLSLGSINSHDIYTMEDLKDKLRFNKIFINNMQEVFEKHNYSQIVEEYIESLTEYHKNIIMIKMKMSEIDPTICIERAGSFEQRLTNTSMNLINQIISECHISGIGDEYNFLDNLIYYISCITNPITHNKYFVISYVDPARSIYHITPSYDFNDKTAFWKSDHCIMDCINQNYGVNNTVAVKITRSVKKSRKIVKVEYYGSVKDMDRIKELFPSKTLIVSNGYLYTDDIERILDSRIRDNLILKQEDHMIPFADIFEKDILIEFPSVSFDVYLQLLRQSINNNVISINISLYRIGEDPSIYYILKDAVNSGIYVHVNIEMCASGEHINRFWRDEMLAAGIHVTTYKSGELKVHSKITLIKFNDGRMIAQIGTGNYHTKTTRQYTDLSLLTSDVDICRQVMVVFDRLDDNISEKNVRKLLNKNLLVTRYGAREELIRLINQEALLGFAGYISIKCNSINDDEFINALDRAADAGCQIDLIVRGVCTWVPDRIGNNVTIKSVVWDKLEHSRVYCFGKINPIIYMGSLDPVTNKLDRRIETLVKINDARILKYLVDYMNKYIINSDNSWKMLRSGEYMKEV